MRGEYNASIVTESNRLELPPRARRIRSRRRSFTSLMGTTSACAENTGCGWFDEPEGKNYLRVRGEYEPGRVVKTSDVELPPRARRIQSVLNCGNDHNGTTSACAENTGPAEIFAALSWNYLRVRGEYWSERNRKDTIMELPPRARRIHSLSSKGAMIGGTTSACAENTSGVCESIA